MSKTFKALIVVLFLTVSLPSPVYAADIYGINDLVEHAAALDGTEVTVTGEAIGEAMERGEYAWVNLSDGTNAIGIWLPLTEAKLITYFGDYKNKGDSVRITGIFNRACADHGGDLDIHCSKLEIISIGHPVKETLSPVKIAVSSLSVFLMFLSLVIYLKIMKKHR